MNCAACGAPAGRDREYCPLCGAARAAGANPDGWDRQVEAAAYEDLQRALPDGESLLGASRGKLVGNWRPRLALDPRAWISPYANVGLTHTRLLLQAVDQNSGAAVSGVSGVPLTDVADITLTDVDSIVPGRTVRLNVLLRNGEQFRLRVTGRLARSASGIAEVWRSLFAPELEGPIVCGACQRDLERPSRFCPYCGSAASGDCENAAAAAAQETE